MLRRLLSLVAAIATAFAVLAPGASPLQDHAFAQQPGCQTFTETGMTICGKFSQYWQQHGGLPQQGYPISRELQEKSDTDGKTYTVQYFERAEFELHPENQPPYDVLLSLLGTMAYKLNYPNGATELPPDANAVAGRLFSETGNEVKGVFLDYWNAHGGLAQQGYPISNLIREKSPLDGKEYTVQYFERAEFELHPENQPPYNILLSQLGTFQYKRKYLGEATPLSNPMAGSTVLSGHTEAVTNLAWSPDGSVLSSSSGPLSGGTDDTVRLWKPDSTPMAALSGHNGPVAALAWSPDGTMLASGSHDGTIRLWSPSSVPLRTIQANKGTVFSLAWSPDGQVLASGSVADPSTNTVQLWKPDGTLLNTLTTSYSGGKFYNLGWSPDGKYLVGGATDYKLWRAGGSEVFHSGGGAHSTPSWGFAWSPDGSRWAIGDESGDVVAYDTSGNVLFYVRTQGDANSLAWSPDGKVLAGGDGVSLWQSDGTPIASHSSGYGRVNSLAWSPDGKLLASANDNKTVNLWSPDGSLVATLAGHSGPVRQVAWSPDGSTLASASEDKTLRLWKMAGKDGGSGPAQTPVPSPDDAWAALRQRPLSLPAIAPGATCPASTGRSVSPDFGIALGQGPIYAAGFGTGGSANLAIVQPTNGLYIYKVLWVGNPAYAGPVLVRGRQIDGPGQLLFDLGSGAGTQELLLHTDQGGSSPSGWYGWPTHTHIPGPGCYAYQVDGSSFTEIIVFRAED